MGAHMAVHAARRRRLKQAQDREEEMTRYTGEDLDRYEFKIMRSPYNQFRKPDVLTQMLEEEKVHGWELLEKLDDGRVRLVREKNGRRMSPMNGSDPYRTQYGGSAYGSRVLVTALILGVMVLGVGFMLLLNDAASLDETVLTTAMIGILVVFIGVAAAIKARLR